MTLAALFLLVAAIAALLIAGCLERVDVYEIGPVALGFIVAIRVQRLEVGAYAATIMAIETVGLGVTLPAVDDRLASYRAMISDPVAVMVGGDTFAFMA